MMLALLTALVLAAPEIPDPPCHVRDANGYPKACPEADAAVVRAYATSPHGKAIAKVRFSIATATTRVKVGEPVRILHVMETLDATELWIMGPKAISGLRVDGALRGPETSRDPKQPWVPESYDGAVITGPGLDSNFEITELRFDEPGRHTVVWHVGRWRSNTLVFEVSSKS